jgi:uncharacterized protein YndB with AHSA1/START domain
MTTRRRPALLWCIALAAYALAGGARAEVRASSPDAFQISFTESVNAPPSAVFAAIGQVERWWDGAHTYSGSAANLSVAMQPGGCWCERWAAGAVEHARVLMVMKDQAVRFEGGLGPLQNLGVSAVLTFVLQPEAAGTTLMVGYRVNGSSASGLDKLAAPVDGVIGAAVQRLKRYVETGKPAA